MNLPPAATLDSRVVSPTALLAVTGLTKSFGAIVANRDLAFTVLGGEVHALLGENGAGKSTLLKSLYGIHRPDSGQILVNGDEVEIGSPADARDAGIGMVFQDMRLIPALTVWENVALHLRDTPRILKPRALQKEIAEASARYRLSVDPLARVNDLSIGEWQRVELLKVLLGGARILLLDEPTSILTPQEVEALFDVVRTLTGEGVGVVLISHKTREIREIADRLTILRGGETVITDAVPDDYTDEELIAAMVGSPVAPVVRRSAGAPASTGEPVLALTDVTVHRPDGSVGLHRVDVALHAGEILGVAGIAGNGQDEFADALVGMADLSSGALTLDGVEIAPNPKALRRAGVVDVVADPTHQFVVEGMSIAEHVALWESSMPGSGRRFDIRRAIRSYRERNTTAGLRAADASRRLDQLSGGNVQRVALTLALTESSKVIVASYPTRGLDVLTAERTCRLLFDAADRGVAVVVISEDLDELLAVSDRIAVLNHGRIAGVVDAATSTRTALGTLMTERVE